VSEFFSALQGLIEFIDEFVERRHLSGTTCQRLVVAMTFLNQSAPFEIEDVDLETIG
jgi:hypothetical protein